MENITKNTANITNPVDKEKIDFIKQKTEEARAKLLKLSQKHNLHSK